MEGQGGNGAKGSVQWKLEKEIRTRNKQMEQTKTTKREEEEEKRGRYENTNYGSPLGGVVGTGSGRCISNDAP